METRENILIVDDSKLVVSVIKDALKNDYNIKTAADGEEALASLDEFVPDLVLLDVRMPGLNGYQVCKEVKRRDSLLHLKVIMISGETDLRNRLEGFEAGADDYISKPIEIMELKAKVKVFLRLKVLEDRFQEMNDYLNDKVELRTAQLIEAEKLSALGRYAAGIVHNLNNPLQLLMGHAELFMMEYPDNPYIRSLLKAAQSMKEMIATILTNYSMASNTIKIEIDFNEMLADLVEIMKADQFFKHNVDKILDLKPLPIFMGVYSHFDQIFGNLLKNAVEAMHDSDIRELTVATSSSKEMIHICIADTGQGIKSEDINKIFDPFYTTKPLIANDGKPIGTGLGLASTKEMIESYKGTISVASEIGKGSVFKIDLPIESLTN